MAQNKETAEQLFKDLLSQCKKDKNRLIALKELALKCQLFEFAADLREMEKELFPEPKETVEAKGKAEKLNLLFRMVELSIPNDIAWLISETLDLYKTKKGKFDIEDGIKLINRKKQIFNEK